MDQAVDQQLRQRWGICRPHHPAQQRAIGLDILARGHRSGEQRDQHRHQFHRRIALLAADQLRLLQQQRALTGDRHIVQHRAGNAPGLQPVAQRLGRASQHRRTTFRGRTTQFQPRHEPEQRRDLIHVIGPPRPVPHRPRKRQRRRAGARSIDRPGIGNGAAVADAEFHHGIIVGLDAILTTARQRHVRALGEVLLRHASGTSINQIIARRVAMAGQHGGDRRIRPGHQIIEIDPGGQPALLLHRPREQFFRRIELAQIEQRPPPDQVDMRQ